MLSLLIAVIIAALIFDYINGFHDAANAIATSVSTGVLPIRTAVIIAAIFNFVGAFVSIKVATTIAGDLADAKVVTLPVVLAALLGASAWNLLTWWRGIPSSSSHALLGGLAGAVGAQAGFGALHAQTLVDKVLIPLVVSPLLGFAIAFFLMIGLLWLVRNSRPTAVAKRARVMQLVSASAMAVSHGSNDAQKVMGIVTLTLLSFSALGGSGMPDWMMPVDPKHIPTWVIISCATAMALGTAAGGKRIIKTMGTKIIRITPLQGFAAETAGALTILGASAFGASVSTTHCINAAIMGVGASKRLSAVRWGVAGNMVVAWVLTIPLAGGMAFLMLHVLRAIF